VGVAVCVDSTLAVLRCDLAIWIPSTALMWARGLRPVA
jgi:hypothetical protein